jgi:hypothetical protein
MGRISGAMIVFAAGSGFGWTALAGVLLIVFGVALLVLVDAPRRFLGSVRRRMPGRRARPADAHEITAGQQLAPFAPQYVAIDEQYGPTDEQYAPVEQLSPMEPAQMEPAQMELTQMEPTQMEAAPMVEPEPVVAPRPVVAPGSPASDLWVTVPDAPPAS